MAEHQMAGIGRRIHAGASPKENRDVDRWFTPQQSHGDCEGYVCYQLQQSGLLRQLIQSEGASSTTCGSDEAGCASQ